VLLDTINYLLRLDPGAAEILVVDQTEEYAFQTADALGELANAGKIRWLRLTEPSITHAMNVGLLEAQQDVVLFLDDDIIPGDNLIAGHARAHEKGLKIVAGQVLQPGEEPDREPGKSATFQFRSATSRLISDLMGGNFSIKRELALQLRGFDENFVHAAYRFEAEFAARALAAGEKILFEPEASIRHLKAGAGGIRAYGDFLTTMKPSHAVGEYYYLLRAQKIRGRLLKMLRRPLRAVRTKHHLSHPWWIPATLIAEARGFIWAVGLALRGPRLIGGRMTDDGGPETSDRRLSSVVGRQSQK
jgi:GT2 family glycosyltransferase